MFLPGFVNQHGFFSKSHSFTFWTRQELYYVNPALQEVAGRNNISYKYLVNEFRKFSKNIKRELLVFA